MSMQTSVAENHETVVYPDSDGKPMAENTKQYEWIVTLKGNLDILFRESPDVFVAGDLLWYPVRGNNLLRAAPDVFVAFGAPKGDRGSYRQWEEGGIPPQVVFEILSPGNRMREMALKFDFYETYGVEEYYIYNPDTFDFSAWHRSENRLRIVEDDPSDSSWSSPLLGVQFIAPGHQAMQVFYPDKRPFLTVLELDAARHAAEQRAAAAEQRAETAEQRAEAASQRAESAEQRAQQMAARLRDLGIDPETT